jgi:hypothetical protein
LLFEATFGKGLPTTFGQLAADSQGDIFLMVNGIRAVGTSLAAGHQS